MGHLLHSQVQFVSLTRDASPSPMVSVKLPSFFAGGAFLVGGNAIQAGVAFAANLVLVRYLDATEFGHFALTLASAWLVLTILSLRLSILIIRAPEAWLTRARRDIYSSALLYETILAIGLALCWRIAIGGWSVWDIILIVAIGSGHWLRQNKAFFERGMPYRRLAGIETGAALVSHLLSVALVVFGAGAAALYLREAALILVEFIGLWAIGGIALYRVRWLSRRDWRGLFAEARGIWLDSVLEGAFQRITLLLAGMLGGERGAGYFFQAHRLAIVPHQFLAPVVTRLVTVWFSRIEPGPARRSGLRRLLIGTAVLLVPAAIGAVALADPIVPAIFGEPWRPVIPILIALAGMVFFLSLFEIFKAFCMVEHRSRTLFAGRVAQYGALAAVLAPAAMGAALSMERLGLALSVAYAAAFMTLFLLSWRGKAGGVSHRGQS